MDPLHQLAQDTLYKNKQAIVFTASRASAEKTAEELSKLTTVQLLDLSQKVLKSISSPTKQCRRLSNCIKKGMAFHHSGLTSQQKDLIEEEFKKGTIKIICATPSLAAGLSLPAFRVILKSLKRYSGRRGMDWIPVLEYYQMAGRAGRPEYESFGEAIAIAKTEAEKEQIHERYILGEPEEIYSKLAAEPALRMDRLSLISAGIIKDYESMKNFFSQTFWAHQFKDTFKLEAIMEKITALLEEWGFITLSEKTTTPSDFTPANKINQPPQGSIRSTLIGKRVSELYLDPLTARHLLDCLKNFTIEKKPFSILQMISNSLEMYPKLRVKVKEQDKIQESLVENYDLLLQEEPSAFDYEYDDFINSIKTTLFFEAWINEKEEDFLLEEFDVRPGEIRVKMEIANWLLYASHELAKLTNLDRLLIREISKLRIRIKNGVKEDLLPLLKLKGIGRIRSRKLVNNNLKDLGDLKKVDITSLSQILGPTIAVDIKKQLGEEIKEIPKGKRKGQLSLNKY